MTAVRFTNQGEVVETRQADERADAGFKRTFDELVTRPIPRDIDTTVTRPIAMPRTSTRNGIDQRFEVAEPPPARTVLAAQAQAVAEPRTRSRGLAERVIARTRSRDTQSRTVTAARAGSPEVAPPVATPRTRSKDTLKTPVSRTQGLSTLRAPAPKADASSSDPALPAATSSDATNASTNTDSTATATVTANPRVSQVIAGVVDALIALTGTPDAIDLPDPDAQVIADRVFAGAITATEPSLPAIVIDEPNDTQPIEVRDVPRPAATPLEQAIQDLLLAAHAEASAPADAPVPVGPAMPATQPEMLAGPSHMHLVMDDGAVLTVAVRGNDVHVAMRGDDRTAAGLARNAAVLDDALRDRGMTLAELDAQPDPRRQRDAPQRERPDHETETFTLEDNP